MSEYTSTREGFERAMQWALTGPAEETEEYVNATSTPNFFQIMNRERLDRDTYIKHIKDMRPMVSEYKVKIEDFVRNDDKLAARMTGTIKIQGVGISFESFMFARIDKETGKMNSLIERAIQETLENKA